MKNSFVMYTDYMEQINLLTMEQRGLLFTAIMQYASGDALPEMDGMTGMAFSFIKSKMDRDFEKYQQTVEKRKEAGKLGGRPKAKGFEEKQEKAKKANGFSEKQKKQMVFQKSKQKQKNPDNDNDSDNDNVNDKKNIYTASFEQLWDAYPRKKEKARAYRCYKARLNDGFSEDALFTAVKRYADECRIKNTDAEYIKHGATFFSADKPFEDYLAEDYKPPTAQSAVVKDMNNFERRSYDMDSLEQSLLGR